MKIYKTILKITGAAAILIGAVAMVKKPGSIYDDKPEEQNPYEGKRVRFVRDENEPINADGEPGHLEEAAEDAPTQAHVDTLYTDIIKPGMDQILSFLGLLLLAPFLLLLSMAIYLDDPGPVLFTQKRLGKDKRFFKLHKFRTMKMSTPHDVPTHMLEDPESYITRVGKILRKMSLDELPQLWDIFLGNMSLVGPRPGLWNQDILTSERDKYDANEVRPGLTGWAQVNGRDELELAEKAKLDGEYCKQVSLKMDLRCLLMTVINVFKQNGIIEGGTGKLNNTLRNNKRN